MPPKIHLTGHEPGAFGRWRVLRESPERPNGAVAWVCLCDPELGGCGAEKVVSGMYLRSGESRSCGCLDQEAKVARAALATPDMTARRFGSVTVLGRTERPPSRAGSGAFWLCRCDCGAEFPLSTGELHTREVRRDKGCRSCRGRK